MKVIVLFNSFDHGSTGTLCGSLKNFLIDSGIRVLFICGNAKKTGNADYYVTEHNNKLSRYLTLKKNNLLGKMFLDFENKATKRTISFLKQQIDFQKDEVIFHFHNMQYSFLSIKRLLNFANKMNIKTILTMHDCWPITGGCNYFTLNKCDKWENVQNPCYKCKHGYLNSRHEIVRKQQLLKDSIIVSPSKWLDYLVGKSILRDNHHLVINNGIDTGFWNYSLSDKKRDTINLISVASPWDERKGLSFLFDLSDALPNNYRMTIVGLRDEQMRNDKRIVQFGKVEKETLKKLYSESHIFINPTLEDNFPTVNIEALLCGLYICSFDTGGSKEIFDAQTGCTTKDKNVLSILELIKDVKPSEALYEKCRNRGLTFNLETFCNKYYTLYLETFSSRS